MTISKDLEVIYNISDNQNHGINSVTFSEYFDIKTNKIGKGLKLILNLNLINKFGKNSCIIKVLGIKFYQKTGNIYNILKQNSALTII